MKSIYQNSKNRVKKRESESRWFGIKTGVRQGEVLLPQLFIVFMDKCMREVCTCEYKEITMAYTDDVATITENQRDLNKAVNIGEEGTDMYGLNINAKETKIVNINRHRQENDIYIDQQLKQVSQFRYLGVLFMQDNIQEK